MTGLFRLTDASGRLIRNPGFEKYAGGLFTHWTTRNSPTISQSESNVFAGRYSARVQNTFTVADRGIHHDVIRGLIAARVYKVSVRVFVTAGTAVLSASDANSFNNESRASSTGTGWQRLEVDKAAAAGGIRISLYARDTNTDAYFDDVRIATATVDFIDGNPSLFNIVNWNQNVARYKSGGVWQESPLADGRRLVGRNYENYLEQPTFQVEDGATEDATIEAVQDLFALMEAAADFAISDGKSPAVYLEARGRNETNTRYALIHRAEVPELPDPYSIEWAQLTLMDMTLEVEHGEWLSMPPGEGIFVPLTTQGMSGRYDRTDIPTQSGDDCSVDIAGAAINLTNANIELGNGTVGDAAGFRFRTVDIPPGSTIVSASITFESGGAATDKVIVLIRGEASVTPAVFSTYANYIGRIRTDEYVRWQIESFSGAGVAYTTPDITAIIQEIIDLPSWASGNNIAIFIEELESAAGGFRLVGSWDSGSAVEPTLNITYTYPLGQEVYIANKRNEASITTVIVTDDSAGTSTAREVPVTLPLTLFPASPAVNDSVTFMCRTTGPSASYSGPFNNLLFNLSTAASASTSYAITWKYYNGAWTALTVQDNTEQFSLTGVHSVHFNQPSDWTTVTIGLSVGYAVRAELTALSGTFTSPVQQTQDIYTVTWPYAEIDDDIVGGDRPAAARLQIINESNGPLLNAPQLWSNRIIVGLRSLSRGRDFTAYLNFADEQNPPGVTVSILNESGGTPSFVAAITKATGRALDWSPTGISAAFVPRAQIALDETLSYQYAGAYHVYVRARQVNGSAGDIGVRLGFRPGGNNLSALSDPVTFAFVADDQLLDMGRMNLMPGYQINDVPAHAAFILYANNTASAARQVIFYDLVLIPCDEWLGDFVDWDAGTLSAESMIGRLADNDDNRYLDADGLRVPRPRAVIRNLEDDSLYVNYRQNAPGAPILQARAAQRLWFLSARHLELDATAQMQSEVAAVHRVTLYMSQKYKAGRGSR